MCGGGELRDLSRLPMRIEIPAVRILPMSDKNEGFRGRTIEQVQASRFLRHLPGREGRFRYLSVGLNAMPGTVVLFQFQARIIASAVFRRDEKFTRPRGGHAGALHFDVDSIRVFDPLDLEAMRKIWPGIGKFGHVKQYLNPGLYPKFKRRLRHVKSPSDKPANPRLDIKPAQNRVLNHRNPVERRDSEAIPGP